MVRSDPAHSRLLGHGMALFVTVVWGTTFISSKLLLAAFTPLEIMTFRFLIAWVVLFLLSPHPILPKSLRGELPFIGAGITGLTLYFILENTALEYTLASNVGIIISAAPMFSALLLWAFRRTGRPRPTFFLGFLIAMSGIALISLAGGEGLDLNPLGNLLTLGAALCWGLYGVCLETAGGQGLTQLQATRKVFFYGILTMLPLFPVLRPSLSLSPFFDQPVMIFHILYLGLAASALCFVCWNRAMALIGTVATNVYIYLTPVITLIASALILNEPVLPQALGPLSSSSWACGCPSGSEETHIKNARLIRGGHFAFPFRQFRRRSFRRPEAPPRWAPQRGPPRSHPHSCSRSRSRRCRQPHRRR